MKKLYVLYALMWCFTSAWAQTADQPDYCQQISRDTDATKTMRTYQSPAGPISVRYEVNASGKQFSINFNTHNFSLYEDEGLFIKFADGKTLKYFGQHIKREYTGPRDGYSYDTNLALSPEQLMVFKTKKITKFQIASVDVLVKNQDAVEFMAYANCITAFK